MVPRPCLRHHAHQCLRGGCLGLHHPGCLRGRSENPGSSGLHREQADTRLPIVIQDKIFVGSNIGTADPTWVSKGLPSTPGSLWYPHVYEKNRWKLIGAGSKLPNPSVIAEMFGDTMLANGTVYPEVPVEPRRYRLRILNACNARFLNLQLLVANYENAPIPTESVLSRGLSRTLSPVPIGSFSGLKPDFSKTRQLCLPTSPSALTLTVCPPEASSPATPNVGMSLSTSVPSQVRTSFYTLMRRRPSPSATIGTTTTLGTY